MEELQQEQVQQDERVWVKLHARKGHAVHRYPDGDDTRLSNQIDRRTEEPGDPFCKRTEPVRPEGARQVLMGCVEPQMIVHVTTSRALLVAAESSPVWRRRARLTT